MAITIFEGPVAEYKTMAGAVKFSKRLIKPAKVVKASQSYFDPLWPKGKPVYQVILQEEV